MLLTLFAETVLVNGWQTLYVSQDADGDIYQTGMITSRHVDVDCDHICIANSKRNHVRYAVQFFLT